jgi:hypothetical protein
MMRRTFNQAFFNKLLIDDDYTVTSELAEPFDKLLDKNPLDEASARKSAPFTLEFNPEDVLRESESNESDEIFHRAAETLLVGAGGPSNFIGSNNVAGG